VIQNLLIDLDGTLTDPKPGITRCIQYALKELGKEAPDIDDLVWCIGPPLLESFKVLLKDEEGTLAAKALALYRDRFGDVGLYENDVYGGIPELLAEQAGNGRRLFVASSKPQVYVHPILEHFDLATHFEGIYGSELDGTRTDKRDLLRHLFDQEKLSPSETLMIGDRVHDVEGARAVGIPVVWVDWGYGSDTEREVCVPDHICGSLSDLRTLLNTL